MNIDVSICDGPLPPAGPHYIQGAGAILTFEGLVRSEESGRAIAALDYEVYDLMARKMLTELALQMRSQFDLLAVFVEHSRGRVPAEACSFRLCMISRHRAEGLQAMALFIDQMKRDVPIWKRPVYRTAEVKS